MAYEAPRTIFASADELTRSRVPHKTVILNPKGGSGKTTLATNLASAYARRGAAPLLLDADPKGFSTRWLETRPSARPGILGMRYCDRPVDLDTWVEKETLPPGCREMIIDLPAGVSDNDLHVMTYFADSVLIPVMPSQIDIHAATRLVAELLIDAQISRGAGKLAIVATRVRANTRSFQMLLRFLGRLQIPLIATLRDSQNFVQATAEGLGVCDLPPYRARDDASQLNGIVDWLEQWRARRLVTSAAASGFTTRDRDPSRTTLRH